MIFPFSSDYWHYRTDQRRFGKLSNVVWFQKNKDKDWCRGQNFGDYLSLVVVHKILTNAKLDSQSSTAQLAAIGSILHFAQDNDVVWGAGINGKVAQSEHQFNTLDVRMVRGPLSRKFLLNKGVEVPALYGDPALLLPTLFPELKKRTKRGKIIVIPNLNEIALLPKPPGNIKVVSPLLHYKRILSEILSSELVLASSLHGIIVAEAFDVSVRFVMPVGGETIHKYRDYYTGTGRTLKSPPSSFLDGISQHAGIAMGKPVFDAKAMLAAFPKDIYRLL